MYLKTVINMKDHKEVESRIVCGNEALGINKWAAKMSVDKN